MWDQKRRLSEGVARVPTRPHIASTADAHREAGRGSGGVGIAP
jgi:hypothetical protein